MHELVSTYGKPIMNELIGQIMINNKLDKQRIYDVLREQKIINGRTKDILVYYRHWIRSKIYHIEVRSMSGNKYFIKFDLKETDIPQILEDIRR